jgi:hypothetical protein
MAIKWPDTEAEKEAAKDWVEAHSCLPGMTAT